MGVSRPRSPAPEERQSVAWGFSPRFTVRPGSESAKRMAEPSHSSLPSASRIQPSIAPDPGAKAPGYKLPSAMRIGGRPDSTLRPHHPDTRPTEVIQLRLLAEAFSVSRERSVDNDLSGPTDGLDKFGTNPKQVPLNRMSRIVPAGYSSST